MCVVFICVMFVSYSLRTYSYLMFVFAFAYKFINSGNIACNKLATELLFFGMYYVFSTLDVLTLTSPFVYLSIH